MQECLKHLGTVRKVEYRVRGRECHEVEGAGEGGQWQDRAFGESDVLPCAWLFTSSPSLLDCQPAEVRTQG